MRRLDLGKTKRRLAHRRNQSVSEAVLDENYASAEPLAHNHDILTQSGNPAPPKEDIRTTILQDLEDFGPCTVDDLRRRLPGYTWSYVFGTVGRLAQEGRLTLRQTVTFEYRVSLGTGDRLPLCNGAGDAPQEPSS